MQRLGTVQGLGEELEGSVNGGHHSKVAEWWWLRRIGWVVQLDNDRVAVLFQFGFDPKNVAI